MGENYGGSQIGQDNSSGKTSNIAQGGVSSLLVRQVLFDY